MGTSEVSETTWSWSHQVWCVCGDKLGWGEETGQKEYTKLWHDTDE